MMQELVSIILFLRLVASTLGRSLLTAVLTACVCAVLFGKVATLKLVRDL